MGKSDRSRPPRVALYGQCGFGNFGNDATMELVLTHLRRTLPDVDFMTIVRVPGTVESNLKVRSIPMYPPPRFAPRKGPLSALSRAGNEIVRVLAAIKAVSNIDYIVMAGGGRFDDFNSRAMEQPYWLWKWISLARFFQVPVEFLAIGAGPIDFKISKWFYKSVAEKVTRRSFRDEESKRYVKDVMRVNTDGDEVTADLVFAFPVRGMPNAPNTTIKTVGVGVMEYNNRRGEKGGASDQYQPYLAHLVEICLGLLDRGHKVRILIGETCDLSAARDLYAALGEAAPAQLTNVTLNPAAANMHDVIAQIAEVDAVIATRFHNVVASLMLGRPTLSLGYASKSDRLMEDFGLGAYCQTIETCDPERLLAQFDNLAANAAELGPKIKRRAAELRRVSEVVLERLTTRIRAAIIRLEPVEDTTPAPTAGPLKAA